MTRKAVGTLLAAVTVATAAVLTTALIVDAQGPIRLGASLSLTGTYAKLGKNADARRELERALASPKFADADDAKKVLDTLR